MFVIPFSGPIECKKIKIKNKKVSFDPDVIRTRNLLIWSQTRYRCATESDKKYCKNLYT